MESNIIISGIFCCWRNIADKTVLDGVGFLLYEIHIIIS